MPTLMPLGGDVKPGLESDFSMKNRFTLDSAEFGKGRARRAPGARLGPGLHLARRLHVTFSVLEQ
jgi:hypothetical protein